MKKDTGKKSKAHKDSKGSPKDAKVKTKKALENFLESQSASQERVVDDREKAKKLAMSRKMEDKPTAAKKEPKEKPAALDRDLKTRNLVDQFYGEEAPEGSEAIEELDEEVAAFEPEVVEPEIMEPEEVFEEENEGIEEAVMTKIQSQDPSEEVKEVLLDSMKRRGLREDREITPKEKEAAENVNFALGAAEGLYKGTRKVTRETIDFAGGVARGSLQVVTTVAGGVLSLLGKSVLGVARVAGIGYRGVGTVASGLGKGVSNLTGTSKGGEKSGVGSIASGIARKTSDFLRIEDSKKKGR